MASEAHRRVALLSIHPRFADAIMRGEKRVEFRRRGPAADTAFVIVYATAPVRRVVGWFRVGAVEAHHPEILWLRFGPVGGIEPDEFESYYAGAQSGTAISVAHAERLDQPVTLASLDGSASPPQSFRYVPWSAFQNLRLTAG
jgi:predicted transcriptional regulator